MLGAVDHEPGCPLTAREVATLGTLLNVPPKAEVSGEKPIRGRKLSGVLVVMGVFYSVDFLFLFAK